MDPLHGDSRELGARLALAATPALTAPAAMALVRRHGSARAAVQALRSGPQPELASAVHSASVRERVRRALDAIEREPLHVLAFDDEDYPAILHTRLDTAAPPLLFARGATDLLALPAVAVVGSRAASGYGLDIASALGDATARAGACVVSGLALGIDAAAHEAALEAGGATIGVLGCGVDVYYPRRNTALQDRIAEAGLLLSEQLPGEPPRRFQFPHRNRIIAALSRAVVIVEAGARSGALGTAVHAMEQGVPLYGVPNALDRPSFQGVLGLFRDGVPPFTGARDVLEECGILGVGAPLRQVAAAGEPPADATARLVWDALTTDGAHVDRIARTAGVSPHLALATLLELELDGRALQQPGGRFSRAPTRNRRLLAG